MSAIWFNPLRGRMSPAWLLLACALLWVGSGCGKKQVSRIDTDTIVDLSGYWNDTDSRLVAEAIIAESVEHPWATRHMQQHTGELPIVIVGAVRNLSTEHIALGTFMADIERALINSGRAMVVASAEERKDLRFERADQWENASAETVKRIGQEMGADYMMYGEIHTITDQEDGKKVIFYQVDLTLADIESNVKVWLGQHKIKKYIARGKYKP
jgi:penicillin-binding protein activator